MITYDLLLIQMYLFFPPIHVRQIDASSDHLSSSIRSTKFNSKSNMARNILRAICYMYRLLVVVFVISLRWYMKLSALPQTCCTNVFTSAACVRS